MRLPRFRFTVRRMMIAVAVAAVLLTMVVEGMRLKRFRERYLHGAELSAYQEQGYRKTQLKLEDHLALAKEIASLSGNESDRRWNEMNLAEIAKRIAKMTRIADYHSAMKAKYARAARRPWLPVAPDPPEPE